MDCHESFPINLCWFSSRQLLVHFHLSPTSILTHGKISMKVNSATNSCPVCYFRQQSCPPSYLLRNFRIFATLLWPHSSSETHRVVQLVDVINRKLCGFSPVVRLHREESQDDGATLPGFQKHTRSSCLDQAGEAEATSILTETIRIL